MMSSIKRSIKLPYRAAVHVLSRLLLAYEFVRVIPHLRQMELSVQKYRQDANDYRARGMEKEANEAVGFAKGVEWCLKKGWLGGIIILLAVSVQAKNVDIGPCAVNSLGNGDVSYNCILNDGEGRISVVAGALTPEDVTDRMIETKAIEWAESLSEQAAKAKKDKYKTKKWKVNY